MLCFGSPSNQLTKILPYLSITEIFTLAENKITERVKYKMMSMTNYSLHTKIQSTCETNIATKFSIHPIFV